MELNSKMICDMFNEVYEQAKKDEEQEKQETVKFVRSSDMVICIKVNDFFDPYSLADRLEDILDNIPAVKDMIIFLPDRKETQCPRKPTT